ncbi:MAG: ComEC/Rec2 family competence protein [Candidatus Levybacteria bacterium]|nr:ComEC/Rec2 family competence protein [Candidatus Levybacteria bacterium]
MNLKLLVLLLIILSFRFYFFYSNQHQFADKQQVSFETTILSQPQVFGSRQAFTANYQNQKIRITTSRFPELNYGDFVRIFGRISNQNNRVLMYFPKIEILKDKSFLGGSLKAINRLREKMISLFSKTLPTPASSLLLGIIFGIKEQMPKDFSDNLKTSGVFHVIAASGMNVTLVGGFISTFCAFFLKRQIAIGLSILGIIFYAVLAGLEASIIRASIMGILVFSAQIIGRQTLAVNGLFLAGFIMLFIDPTLISDIGFQLSFAATLGLILIPKIRAIGEIRVIGDSINTTIAAQIATLPILLANFGTHSIYSVLVNGLVLWTVQILMVIGGIGALIGLVFMPLGQFVIYISYPLLIYFETIVQIFGKIGGIITLQSVPWQFIAGYYCLLTSILIVFKRKK